MALQLALTGTPLPRSEFPRHMRVAEAQRRLVARGLKLVADRRGLLICRLH